MLVGVKMSPAKGLVDLISCVCCVPRMQLAAGIHTQHLHACVVKAGEEMTRASE